MRKFLTEKAYRELLKEHEIVGQELRSRKRIRFGRTIIAIEQMHEIMTSMYSWERK